MQLSAEIWQDDILLYLNTDNRAQLRRTRQSVAKKGTTNTCVHTMGVCLEASWTYLKTLLEEVLWFLHKEVSTNPNLSNNKLSVGFLLMGSSMKTQLLFY